MLVVALHGVLIAAFLLAGARWPRVRMPLLGRDTLLNLTTGALLSATRAAVIWSAATHVWIQRCDLSAVRHPALQFLVVFLLSDFARYWVHYAHHRFDFLWRFHRVHHSSTALDATAGLRMHAVDFLQLSLIPVVLFGLLFDCSSFRPWIWPLLTVLTDAFDSFQHANLRMTLESPLADTWGRIFNNPVFHSWHHSRNPGEFNGNFGQALTVWDQLFNTHIAHRSPAFRLGLPRADALEVSLIGLQVLRQDPDRQTQS